MNIEYKQVNVKNIKLGSPQPIVVQSMTNVSTQDKEKLIDQCRKLYNRNCKIIRFATQKSSEIEELRKIKAELLNRMPDLVLVADTHFSPVIAELAVEVFDKVRINPGNFIDRNTGVPVFTPEKFEEESSKIATHFLPFLQKCKKHQTAIRIGTNHGSLSERMLQKYGDTPQGMVASVDEFLKICQQHDFSDIVISLKASSPRLMIEANRLMMKKMIENKQIYPLHLGVTEAGNGDEGRIKSAVGMGTLLLNGIGDTIRVSLTEEPEKEIKPAEIILESALNQYKRNSINFKKLEYKSNHFPFSFPLVITENSHWGDFYIQNSKIVPRITLKNKKKS